MSVPLTELDAALYGAGGDGVSDSEGRPVPRRSGVGLIFLCPCGCGDRRAVSFANPIDGGPPVTSPGQPTWRRTGETIETLTLTPSVLAMDGCRWHGWIRSGRAVTV